MQLCVYSLIDTSTQSHTYMHINITWEWRGGILFFASPARANFQAKLKHCLESAVSYS